MSYKKYTKDWHGGGFGEKQKEKKKEKKNKKNKKNEMQLRLYTDKYT